MDPAALRKLLERLHEELDGAHPVEEDTRTLMRSVLADIQLALEEPTPGPEHHALVGRLKKAGWSLEEAHPRLTTTVSELVDALSRIFQ